ncbi:hypothetical protein VKT23_009170 [Stygiomarasmius scandens]|uniref:C2H2-type domain-containing protein n=1 Tax=Marasmiellus scandens TaxID=2682957 RepID=A0ABR1JHC5_9AGAR
MEQITIVEYSPEGAVRVFEPFGDDNFINVDASVFRQPREDPQEPLTFYDPTLASLHNGLPAEINRVLQEPQAHQSFGGGPATVLPSTNIPGFEQLEDYSTSTPKDLSPLLPNVASAEWLEAPGIWDGLNPAPVPHYESPVRIDRPQLDADILAFRDHIPATMNSPTTSTSSEYFSSPASPSVYPSDCESNDIGVNGLVDTFTYLSDLGPHRCQPFCDDGTSATEGAWDQDREVATSSSAMVTLETVHSSPLGQPLVNRPPSRAEMSSITDAGQRVQHNAEHRSGENPNINANILPASNWKEFVAPYAVTEAANKRRKGSNKRLFSCRHCNASFTAKHNLKCMCAFIPDEKGN